MGKSIVWSALLHVLVVVLAVVGLPRLWQSATPIDHPTIVEVVRVDEKTTAKDQPQPRVKKEEPKKEKKTPPPPEPPQVKPTTAPPPPPEPPKVAERPAPEPEKVPVEPKPEPKKTPEKKPEQKPETKAPTPPKAVAKARPTRKPPQPKEDFLQSVLRDVSPEERAPRREETQEEARPAPAPEEEPKRQAPLDAVVTTSEIDAIRHAIEQCWNIPAGARDAENLVVTIRVWVNPDGTVREARLDRDQSRLSDPFFRAAAESAMRAVLNQRCQPLPIPPKKYDQFKNLVLEFNPKTAAGS